ncbi:MAG: phosphoribosylanthranilate isomerase [Candidatus Omnitrophica bacterium]|nr:phosphoribosylanthranilate isomerase [Candidatus Omnitrophota bacterium]MCK5260541.1 phosphoribosylanthranilate isomerase [Candidatus Omnitrophota bacterium]
MVRVKVCGITNSEDASKAVYYGAWALGFVFTKKSPRYISPSRARKIIEQLPPFVTPVGVFVDQSERAVRDICKFTRISTVQFHGEEKAVYCKRFTDFKVIKAFRIGEFFPAEEIMKYKVDAYLFDTYQDGIAGGTGKIFNWDLLKEHKIEKPVILSGGLSAENVREALEATKPFAIDVSSGVEKAPGIKNPRLIRSFFDAVNFVSR